MNILEEIVGVKRLEITAAKQLVPETELERRVLACGKVRSLKASLLDPLRTGIIAEFKRRSPSKGILNDSADLGMVARQYAAHGASAVSVLTDKTFFGGSNEDIQKARDACEIPILRKEFILEEYQVLQSRTLGADAILLIAACLRPSEVLRLAILARALGMETLLEVHSANELDRICPEIDLVGVNNRDLGSFRVDIGCSLSLISKIPADKGKVTESGISDPATLQSLRQAGYQGFLIGERFMKERDPGLAFARFTALLKETTI